MIPQKKFSKTTIKVEQVGTTKVGHSTGLGDTIDQTYSSYACTGTNHARHFIGSWYILLQLEARVFKVTLEKKSL